MHAIKKKLLRLYLKVAGKVLAPFLCDKSALIVRFDGGISSQLAFWALYRELESKSSEVLADLSWFTSDGMDMNGEHVRNFDLLKAFSKVSIKPAGLLQSYYYRRHFNVSEDQFSLDLNAPAYYGGYYGRWSLFKKYAGQMSSCFSELTKQLANEKGYLSSIETAGHACAVHVRRGDLSVYNPAYGNPLDASYFVEAIKKVEERFDGAKFFIFSDDLSWVREHVVSQLHESCCFQLVTGNDSAKGFVDLYLMASCDSFIASQGSLAKYARLLGDPSRVIVEPSSCRLFDENDEHPSVVLDVV